MLYFLEKKTGKIAEAAPPPDPKLYSHTYNSYSRRRRLHRWRYYCQKQNI